MWNGVARSYNKVIKKGYSIRAVGHLISSKWVDKNTGEDRKQFRFRITKLLRDEEFQAITSSTEHAVDTVPFIDEFHTGDSEYFDSTSSVQNLPSVAGTGES
jgi:single-stranded DNA-binding protein